MAYLREVVSMHDVADVESFVVRYINNTIRGTLTPGGMEDAIGLGLLIMARLYARYDADKDADAKRARKGGDTHACVGSRCCVASFAGYASFVLPKKLQEEWYSGQEEYQSRMVEGKRTYVRYASAVSIDGTEDPSLQDAVSLLDADTTRKPGSFMAVPILPREGA